MQMFKYIIVEICFFCAICMQVAESETLICTKITFLYQSFITFDCSLSYMLFAHSNEL